MGKYSFSFTVGQGAVYININKLILKLPNSTVGCQLNRIYLCILVYGDAIILLSPSRAGLQFMTNLCEHYASEHDLKFSTNIIIS